MLDEKTILEAVEIITDRLLTPVLYMYEDEAVEFICFCDGKTEMEDIRETEKSVYINLGIKVEIVDIREFEETDRVEIIKNAMLVYAVNDIVRMAFESAMVSDLEKQSLKKQELIKRNDETGTYYAQ